MARLRTTLIGIALTIGLTESYARAQQCHSEAPRRDVPGTSVAIHEEFASYQQRTFEGHYAGLWAGVRHDFADFSLGAKVPAYALVRNGQNVRGLGDVSLEANVPMQFASSRTRSWGLALVTSLPTGNAKDSLGMGHVMFMPQLWLRIRDSRFELQSNVGAGVAWMNAAGGHHAHGPQPVVNPMNGEELTFHLQPSYGLTPSFRAQVRLFGAVPITDNGATRIIAGVGLEAHSGSFFSALDLAAPLLGDTYQAKLTLGLGLHF